MPSGRRGKFQIVHWQRIFLTVMIFSVDCARKGLRVLDNPPLPSPSFLLPLVFVFPQSQVDVAVLAYSKV